jgi:S1-C subfamily serine protease
VFGVADPSPAARAGMKEGDIIIGIDGHEVTVYPEMLKIMRARLAGEKIVVRVRRTKKELDLQLVLAVPEDLGDAPQPEPPPPPPAASQPDNEPPPNKPRKE